MCGVNFSSDWRKGRLSMKIPAWKQLLGLLAGMARG